MLTQLHVDTVNAHCEWIRENAVLTAHTALEVHAATDVLCTSEADEYALFWGAVGCMIQPLGFGRDELSAVEFVTIADAFVSAHNAGIARLN